MTLFGMRPFNSGFLDVGGGHKIRFVEYGKKDGIPVLGFHGGPGGKHSHKKITALFSARKYRIITFDQRGCGRSKYADLLAENTPDDTIRDAEKLLHFLGIATSVAVFGGSYGATLALLFAEKNPARVRHLILRSIYLAEQGDFGRRWCYETASLFLPDFADMLIPENADWTATASHYLRFALDNDNRAIEFYKSWVENLGETAPKRFDASSLSKRARAEELQKVKVFLHFEANGYFAAGGRIMRDIGKIRDIPAIIMHNRLDMDCPVKQAWILAKELPNAKLFIRSARSHAGEGLISDLRRKIRETNI